MDHGEAKEPLLGGVSHALTERFLLMIRDGYPKAELATCFLEERAGINNVPNMANVRDVLSHLATFLDQAISDEERSRQISYAEEHLRRAIIEPYQIAVEDLTIKVDQLYGKYNKSILPISTRFSLLASAPNEIQINAKLREIQKRVLAARLAKGRNRWDDMWEEGVKNFTIAFDDLEELHSELERYWHVFEQIRIDRSHTRLHIWGIAATVVAGILGVVVAYLLYLLAQAPKG